MKMCYPVKCRCLYDIVWDKFWEAVEISRQDVEKSLRKSVKDATESVPSMRENV